MDTRNTKKSTEVVPKTGEVIRTSSAEGAEGTEVPPPMSQQSRSDEWRFLCQEFDDNLNSAINSLAIGKKISAPQLCIYFEKIIPILKSWLSSHEDETQEWEKPLHREFLRYANYATSVLKPKLAALKSKGITEEVLLTAVDYRSYANIERSTLEDRSSYARRTNSEASCSVKSALSRPPSVRSRTSPNRNMNAQRRDTTRRSRRGRTVPQRADYPVPYDCETPELLKELRRYAELPQPWNKMPTQSVRLERLDVSRQVQLAGERQFRGDVDDYAKWRDFFIGTIGDVRCHARHKVNALRKSLDSVLETVIDFVPGDFNGYKQIVENLEKSYGGTFRQMSRYDDYFDSAHFKYGVLEGFREYIRKVAGYKALLAASGDAAFFGTPHIYRRMLLPLPGGHVRELQTWLHTERMEPSASNLLLWGQDRLDRLLTEKEVERRKDRTNASHHTSKEKLKPKVLVTRAQWTSDSEPEEYTSDRENVPDLDDEQALMVHYIAQRPPDFCLLSCADKHSLSDCPRFAAMNPERRRAHIRCWKVLTCFACLGFGHSAKNCRNSTTCNVCKAKSHHTLLHRDSDKVIHTIYHVSLLTTTAITTGKLPYLTIKVSKCGNNNMFSYVNAIIDTGSNVTIVSRRIREAFDTRDTFQAMSINTAGGSVSKKSAVVQFVIWTQQGEAVKVSALSFETDEMFGHMEAWDTTEVIRRNPYLKRVRIHKPPSRSIDVLLGNDYPGLTTPQRVIRGPTNSHPVAEKSLLGWSLRGNTRSPMSLYVGCIDDAEHNRTETLDVLRRIERSWELIDKLPYDYISPNDKAANEIMDRTMKLKDGFVEAGILWKESHPPNVVNNRPLALKRLFALWKTLNKNQNVKRLYTEVIEQWLQEGTLVKCTERAEEGKINYLSHFPVVRMSKATTKVRIVVDAAAKYRGTCLNDYVMPGPNLTNDVRRVLLRFRRRPVAVLGDVRSMFTQIKLLKTERSYHRMLWGPDEDNVSEYEFTRFTFGNTCSPSIAMSAARYLTTFFSDKYDRAKEAILNSTIVDDTLDSVDNDEEAVKLITDLRKIYAKGSMDLRKIGSNSLDVMRVFNPEQLSSEILLAFESSESPMGAKTLGVTWFPSDDKLAYRLSIEGKTSSRRDLLSQLAQIYDPLGLISPLLITLKIIVQSTWSEKKDWDSKLSEETLKRWLTAVDDINGTIYFERKLVITPQKSITRRILHIFVDASSNAVGAVAYLVVHYDNGSRTSTIVLSASRVAPLKFTTTPRLELQAAIEGINLAEHVIQTLDINPYEIRYWSDSTDVIHWINSTSRSLKVFVATRVAQIQRKSRIDLWNWVPTNYNPADLISRGTTIEKLSVSKLWKEGPVFLQDESQLPTPKNSTISSLAKKESRTRKKITIQITRIINPYWNNKLKRFSSWQRFLRAIYNILKRIKKNISDEEAASQALYVVVSLLQQELIHDIYLQLKNGKALASNHTYAKYRLFYNNETKAIHASGRLSHTDHLPFLTRFPLFIPEKTYLATLIIRHFHAVNLQHMGGIRSLVSQITTTFAIPYLTIQAKRISQTCIFCKRLTFRTGCPTQAPLPFFRQPQQQRHEIYETSAMDCLGPLYVVKSKSKQEKVYVLVITCVFYRAVHLEIIHTLSSDSFLLAFERFVSSRNRPKQIISDNGRNFLGTWNVLEKIFRDLPQRLSKRYPNIIWKFNTPLDPHKGGIFERMVALTKNNMSKLLRNKKTTLEELETVIKMVEGALNNRPLQSSSQDPYDHEPLTPNHFLRGSPYNTIAPNSSNLNALKTYKNTQQLLNKFWARFINQFITNLNIHPNKKFKNINYQPNQLVLVKEETKATSQVNFPIWPIGKILEVYPGQDGIIRSVKLLLNGKQYIRGSSKIAPLH